MLLRDSDPKHTTRVIKALPTLPWKAAPRWTEPEWTRAVLKSMGGYIIFIQDITLERLHF